MKTGSRQEVTVTLGSSGMMAKEAEGAGATANTSAHSVGAGFRFGVKGHTTSHGAAFRGAREGV